MPSVATRSLAAVLALIVPLVCGACSERQPGAPASSPRASAAVERTTHEAATKPKADMRASALDGLAPAERRAFEADDGFAPLPAPKAGDWRERMPEPLQSVAQFEGSKRVVPTAARRTLYIQPIGTFVNGKSPPLEVLADYARRYFTVDVKVLPALADAELVGVAYRRHHGGDQWFAPHLLEVLRKRLPDDAYGLIGVTMTDLYPDPAWNFVFGLATFEERVGVYSFARYDPAFDKGPRDPEARRMILVRSLKVMAHELGHMFGMAHCGAYQCAMNGSNSLEETDRSPMHLCPVCLRKLHLAVGFSPRQRYAALAQFYEAHALADEAAWTRRQLHRLR